MQAEVLVEFTKGYVGIAMGVVQGVVEIQKQVFVFHKYNLKRRKEKGESKDVELQRMLFLLSTFYFLLSTSVYHILWLALDKGLEVFYGNG